MISRLLDRLGRAYLHYESPLSLLAQRLTGREVVTVADRATGLRFRCRRGADRMLGEIFHSKVYDVPTVPVRSGDLVVDVGANHGFAACYFAARGARVIAFEPDPATYALLVENVATNGLADRIHSVAQAVADRDGTAELRRSPDLGGGMSTIHDRFAASGLFAITDTVPVQTATVGGLGLGPIRLLKLDCEGSELDILRSLDRALLDRIDSLAIEYHPAAYPLSELVDTILGWGDFHLSKVVTDEVANANLHAVSARALAEWADGLS